MKTTESFTDRAREFLAVQGMDQHKLQSMHRKEIREKVKIRHGAIRKPFARFRSGLRTGTTPHFKLWMADVSIKSALQRTTLVALADRHDNGHLAGTYAILSGRGYKSVWDLTHANQQDLLAIKGIGLKRLEEIKTDLASRMVAVNW